MSVSGTLEIGQGGAADPFGTRPGWPLGDPWGTPGWVENTPGGFLKFNFFGSEFRPLVPSIGRGSSHCVGQTESQPRKPPWRRFQALFRFSAKKLRSFQVSTKSSGSPRVEAPKHGFCETMFPALSMVGFAPSGSYWSPLGRELRPAGFALWSIFQDQFLSPGPCFLRDLWRGLDGWAL